VEGSFDEVAIYGISPASLAQYPDGYVRFDELINGKVESTESENFQLTVNSDALCLSNDPAASDIGYFLAIQPKNVLAAFDGVYAKLEVAPINGNWASIGVITRWGDAETGVKLGVYYIGPGPAANGVDGEISVVTTTFGPNGSESSEVFPIHPDLIAPFTLRVEKSNATINFYYNESTTPFATRVLPSPEMRGTYAQLEANVSASTELSACWRDIGVLHR
jgi:hypothetical protein